MAPINDATGSMHNTMADKMDREEAMPLQMQKQFDRGLVNYMVKNKYNWEKLIFIRKTYGMLACFLFLSFLISIPFMKHQQGSVAWLYSESWILWIAAVLIGLQLVFYLVVLGFLYTGQNLLLKAYIIMLISFPLNFVWVGVYTIGFTIVFDTALASFNYAFVSHVFLYTFFTVLALILYTYAVKNCDFKQLYCYLVPFWTAAAIWACLHIFGDASTKEHAFEHFIAVGASIILGWIVCYDTQLIFGTKLERGRKYPYQESMYSMAAYEMYFDMFIHFYLGSLNLFPAGEVDDPLTAVAGN